MEAPGDVAIYKLPHLGLADTEKWLKNCLKDILKGFSYSCEPGFEEHQLV